MNFWQEQILLNFISHLEDILDAYSSGKVTYNRLYKEDQGVSQITES